MKSLNPNIYPHGGHWFRERDGTKIVADSWGGVIARVKKYRERQGSPLGDVVAEVIDQACINNPDLCIEDNGVNRAQLVRTSLKSRVLQWLIQKAKEAEASQLRFISDHNLQLARTDVCLRCPCHQAVKDGCGSCRQAVEEMRERIIKTRPVDGRLHECSVLGEHMPAASWLDEPAVANGELPWECWRKRTL